jgi:hypothetical protein
MARTSKSFGMPKSDLTARLVRSTPSGSSYGITVNSLFDSASVTPWAPSARIVSE